MSQSKKPDLVEREAVKKLIDDMLVAIKEDKVPADLALRALGIKVCGLPGAGPVEAKWEKVKQPDMQFPYWRCSACKSACYIEPDDLDKLQYCPLCGAHTRGVVDEG